MSETNNGDLPPEIKRLLDKGWLAGLRDSSAIGADEVELFGWYVRETDSLIARMESEALTYVRQQTLSAEAEPNDSGLVTVAYVARRVRYSHVIYLTSLLEVVMKRECRRLIDALGKDRAPFQHSQLKGDDWTAKKTVLEAYAKFETPSDLWNPLKQLIDIRNALVHHHGTTDSMHRDQANALAKIKGIQFISGEVEVSAEYVYRAHEAVKAVAVFFDQQVREVIEWTIRTQSVS